MNQWIPWIAGSVALLGVVVACRSAPPEADHQEPAPIPMPMQMQELLSGNLSSIQTNECLSARNETEWLELWQRKGSVQFPPQDPPEVDFEKEMVVAVFLGQRPSAGYTVEVRAVDLVPGLAGAPPNLAVYAREIRPQKRSIQPQVVVTPFHFVRVPKNEGQLELHMER